MSDKTTYITSDGSLGMEHTTLYFYNKEGKHPLPIETLEEVFFMGSGRITTGVLREFSKRGILLHVFGRYGNYLGSYIPKKSLISGEMLVRQVKAYLNSEERLYLAKQFVKGAMANYNHILRRKNLPIIEKLDVEKATTIPELMQIEGSFKRQFYKRIDTILEDKLRIGKRTRMPPQNEANAIISFLNSLTYATVSTEIYHTHLSPEIAYLHEPFQRRLSLSLDISEIFKPLLSEKLLLDMVNQKMVSEIDFETEEGVFLSEIGRRKVIKIFNEELNRVIKMRKSNAKKRIRSLIRSELHKLEGHLLRMKKYKPLIAWW